MCGVAVTPALLDALAMPCCSAFPGFLDFVSPMDIAYELTPHYCRGSFGAYSQATGLLEITSSAGTVHSTCRNVRDSSAI